MLNYFADFIIMEAFLEGCSTDTEYHFHQHQIKCFPVANLSSLNSALTSIIDSYCCF